jgi:hypothetical protein
MPLRGETISIFKTTPPVVRTMRGNFSGILEDALQQGTTE